MVDMEKLVNHAKTSGFVFQGSEIYGGLANSWDYGPLGIELKNNIKKAWWKKFIQESEYNVGIDAAILMNSAVWEASGHLANFSDPLVDCKSCKQRFRADHLIEQFDSNAHPDGWSKQQLDDYLKNNDITCPNCNAKNFTEIRFFQMMFKTNMGVVEDASSTVYLRPETAQGIFVNFKNVQRSGRKKIPFGIGQIGKAFRNEITPGNFIFRTREFEQMELEFFCQPGTDLEWYEYWKQFCYKWLIDLGINKESLRFRDHEKEALSHYSVATCDIEYLMPFGWSELWGIADRTDFDLKAHQMASGKSMEYLDPTTNEKYIPYCIEPSVGTDRIALAMMANAYYEEKVDNETRIVMKLHPYLAPYKVAVLPLTKKLSEPAKKVFADLNKHFMVEYDESGSIGKRYRRQDAIGTPLCITFDFDSLEDQTVTIRDRDTMEQKRVKIEKLVEYINEFINY